MQAVRAALPEISEIHRAGDGPEPDTAYLPPEHVWGILRSDEWQFVDQYTYEHTMCMGVSDLLCLYSGEKLVMRVMEHYGFGEQRTLLIFDETFTPGAEGAKIDGQIRILAPAECYQDLLDTLGEPVEMIEQET